MGFLHPEAETEVEAAIEKGLEEKKRKLHSQMDRVLKYWVSESSQCVGTGLFNSLLPTYSHSVAAKGGPQEGPRYQTVCCFSLTNFA